MVGQIADRSFNPGSQIKDALDPTMNRAAQEEGAGAEDEEEEDDDHVDEEVQHGQPDLQSSSPLQSSGDLPGADSDEDDLMQGGGGESLDV